jgi:SAM-dependent methyltransferase
MADSNVLDRMRQDWNDRAREDPHYYVAFGRREQDDAEFLATAADEARAVRSELQRLGPPGERFPKGLKALEIGCGPGRLMRPLSGHFAEIHGVDISDEMIRLAAERLRDIPNAHVHHTEKSDLSMFPAESFDLIYSYAVFQHIPSREVVFGYFAEIRRVLKRGGILRGQINGLPETCARYTTWDGVRIPASDIAAFALHNDLQLLALEGASTQYMWTTWRKQAQGWRAALRPLAKPSTRIRAISNALTGDQLIPASGARAFAAIWLDDPPSDCDLIGLEVKFEGRPAVLSSLSAPEWDGMVQLTAAVPAGCRTGLVPVEVLWLGQPLTATAWMRVIPPGPYVPRIRVVSDGVNLLSGPRIVSRTIKVSMEEVANPEQFQVSIDGAPMVAGTFCTDPVQQWYDFDIVLPDTVRQGAHEVCVRLGRRTFAPVAVEVV